MKQLFHRRHRNPTDLGGQVRHGLFWSFSNNLFSRMSQLVVGIVLAHLLTPKDFGVFAAALVAFNIVLNVNDLGVSVAIVREPDRTDEIGPTVTTLTLASAAVLAAGMFAVAPFAADLLNAPGATGSLRILSLAVLVGGATAVPAALVQQTFRQDLRMFADAVNVMVSIVVSLVLAVKGFGPSSLAWAWVASNAAGGAVLFAVAPRRFKPGFDRAEARRLIAFGLPLAGSSLLVFAILNVDYAIVGMVLGPIALGLYTLAFNISGWPVNAFSYAVRTVSLPAFARLLDEPERLRSSYTRSFGQLWAVALPVCVLLGVLARPAVITIYGARWAEAANALHFLAALGAFRIVAELSYDFLVAVGRSKTVLQLQLLWLASLIPVLFVAAHLRGIAGVGAGQIIVAGAVMAPAYLLALGREGIRARAIGRAIERPLIGAAACGVTAAIVYRVGPHGVIGLLLAGAAGLATHVAVMWPVIGSALRARRDRTEVALPRRSTQNW